jgi:hypothetical protein
MNGSAEGDAKQEAAADVAAATAVTGDRHVPRECAVGHGQAGCETIATRPLSIDIPE